jgi:CBS domain-containing protein
LEKDGEEVSKIEEELGYGLCLGGVSMQAIKVKDWMVPLDEYATISEDATLHQAVLALEGARERFDVKGYRHRAVIVLEKTGRVIGKLSQLDVLRCLEPKYAELGDLKKISGYGLSAEFLMSMIDRYDLWRAPLDDICFKAARMRIGDITKSPLAGEFIEADASLNQAVHQLIIGHHQSLMATSKGEIVGVLLLTDVFQNIGERIKDCQA